MKNDYEIRGEVTAIFLRTLSGSVFETLIDTEQLSDVLDFPGRWGLHREPSAKNLYYVYGEFKKNGKRFRSKLHRLITKAPTGYEVDHINGDGLDNRISNLRIVTRSENAQNVLRNSRSGYRGVRKNGKNSWQAYLNYEGKFVCLGNFSSPESASEVAKKARSEMMPFAIESRR